MQRYTTSFPPHGAKSSYSSHISKPSVLNPSLLCRPSISSLVVEQRKLSEGLSRRHWEDRGWNEAATTQPRKKEGRVSTRSRRERENELVAFQLDSKRGKKREGTTGRLTSHSPTQLRTELSLLLQHWVGRLSWRGWCSRRLKNLPLLLRRRRSGFV